MTKNDLVKQIAVLQKNTIKLTDKDVDIAVKSLVDFMACNLVSGNKIEVRGFGSFAINTRKPRIGRNPKTGETLNLGVSKIVHFKAGKNLRENVNASYLKEQTITKTNI